jgi:hypothetical protein
MHDAQGVRKSGVLMLHNALDTMAVIRAANLTGKNAEYFYPR